MSAGRRELRVEADAPPRLTAEVLAAKRVPPGSGVSYGHTFTTARETTLALVGIGYGHGIPRHAGNRATVAIGGVRMPIVGRVAMDALVVDAGERPVRAGDEVVVFGDADDGAESLASWADALDEDPAALLMAFDTRVRRIGGARADGGTAGTGDAVGVPVLARVSRSALTHNVELLRARVAPATLMAVVKDDAYGHGLDVVVSALADAAVGRFGTLDLDTAFRVRALAPTALVFSWLFGRDDDLVEAIRQGVDLGVSDRATLDRVVADARLSGTRARIHLGVDTGLSREGFDLEELPAALELIAESTDVLEVVGIWSHLAEASDAADSAQLERYLDALRIAADAGVQPPIRSVGASAASFARADVRHDQVRIGAFIYGIAPGDGVGPADLGLRPAMELSAAVTAVELRDGRTIGVLPIGSAQGIPRSLAHGGVVAVDGHRCAIIAVEPEATLIDAGGAGIEVGDIAVVWGDAPTLQQQADAAGTVGEELVTRLSAAVPRVLVE